MSEEEIPEEVLDEIVKEFIEDYISDDVRDELAEGLKTLTMDEVDAALEVYVKAMLTGDDWKAFEALITLWKAIDEWGEA